MFSLTLDALLWVKRSWAAVKRSTSRILAVMGMDTRKTLASDSLKPRVWYTALKGIRVSPEEHKTKGDM